MKKLVLVLAVTISTFAQAGQVERSERLALAVASRDFEILYQASIDNTVEKVIEVYGTATKALQNKEPIKHHCLKITKINSEFSFSTIDILHISEATSNMYELVIFALEEKASKE